MAGSAANADPNDSRISQYLQRLEVLETSHCVWRPTFYEDVMPRKDAELPSWLQELTWTLSSSVGFKHLHDGTLVNDNALVRTGFAEGKSFIDFSRSSERVLINCSETLKSGLKTGIQRVTRNLAKCGERSGIAVPFFYRKVTKFEKYSPFNETLLNLNKHDIVLLPEATQLDADIELVKRAVKASAEVVVIVHDLIPFSHRGTCNPAHVDYACEWFKSILPYAKRIISPSKATAIEVKNFMDRLENKCVEKIGWFHHGADLDELNQDPSEDVVRILDGLRESPRFLSVGTLEPRKGHHIAIDAFESLWAAGFDVCYLICGKKGWKSEALEHRILRHPEYGHRLFWFREASDSDLSHLYKNCTSLIFPSIAEGFGLPFIEAMRYGTPVIASDIDVFREIGQDFATYFRVVDADDLSRVIRDGLQRGIRTSKTTMKTWEQVANLVFGLVRDREGFQDQWIWDVNGARRPSS